MKKYGIVAAGISAALSACAHAQDNEVITVLGQPLHNQQSKTITASDVHSPDFGDELSEIVGITINRNGPLTGVIQYRGLYGDRVGVQVDDMPITGAGPNSMDSPLSHVLPEPGMRAVLYRGIAPVSSGVQTLGSQVDISAPAATLFAESPGLQASINVTLTSPGDGQQYQASGLYRTENGFVSATFQHQQRRFQEAADELVIPNSHYLRNGTKLRGGYEWGDHQLDVSYQMLDTNESGTPALPMDIGFIDAAWYRAHYQYDYGQDSRLGLTVFGNSNQHAMDNFSQRPLMMQTMARKNTVDALARGLRAEVNHAFRAGTLTAGAEVRTKEHNSVITNPLVGNLTIDNFNGVEQETQSAFAEFTSKWHHTRYVAGIRLTHIKQSAGDVASSMAMMNPNVATLVSRFNQSARTNSDTFADLALTTTTRLTPSLSVHSGIAQKNRAPEYFQRFTWLPLGITGGMADGFTYIGNPDLVAETSRQLDIGFTWKHAQWTVAPRAYYQKIDDYIAGTPSQNESANMIAAMMGNPAPLQWNNTDAEITGLDVTVEGMLTTSVGVSISANHTLAERTDINDPLFRIAPAQLDASIYWDTILLGMPLQVTTRAQLAGSQNKVSTLVNEKATSGYGLVHLSGSLRVSDNISLSLAVDNLFDKAYESHLASVNRVAGEDVAVGERIPGSGRQISLLLHATL